MKSTSSVLLLMMGCLMVSTPIHGRVSKSFVRGFLVGYAKGLEEGKNLVQVQPIVQQVGCHYQPLPEPEPHPEPEHHHIHHPQQQMHQPMHEPMMHESPHGAYQGDGYGSASSNGFQLMQSQARSGQGPIIQDKKASATTAIQNAVIGKLKA